MENRKTEIRIVSLIPYQVLPARLGGEKGIALFTEYLGRLVPLTAITIRSNNPAEAKNYTLLNNISNSRSRYINPFLYFRIKKLIKEQAATHFLIEHPYFGWLAWLVRSRTGITWVVHSHNIEYSRSKSIGRWWWRALKWYESWVYKKADINFFISEDDRMHAISNMKIDATRSYAITYGIEQSSLPGDSLLCRQTIQQRHAIAEDECIMLFNGALYHHTNYDALSVILKEINPLLLLRTGLKYKIIICGKGLPAFFNELTDYGDRNIIYAGFVDDISEYFKAADIFLNPILSGGGVKTKAIEAISMNCTVVSTETGASGLKKEACGNKLYVVKDGDWMSFVAKTADALTQRAKTPYSFFDYYYWGNIAKKVVTIFEQHAQSY